MLPLYKTRGLDGLKHFQIALGKAIADTNDDHLIKIVNAINNPQINLTDQYGQSGDHLVTKLDDSCVDLILQEFKEHPQYKSIEEHITSNDLITLPTATGPLNKQNKA